jgi:hypothetical protein
MRMFLIIGGNANFDGLVCCGCAVQIPVCLALVFVARKRRAQYRTKYSMAASMSAAVVSPVIPGSKCVHSISSLLDYRQGHFHQTSRDHPIAG